MPRFPVTVGFRSPTGLNYVKDAAWMRIAKNRRGLHLQIWMETPEGGKVIMFPNVGALNEMLRWIEYHNGERIRRVSPAERRILYSTNDEIKATKGTREISHLPEWERGETEDEA